MADLLEILDADRPEKPDNDLETPTAALKCRKPKPKQTPGPVRRKPEGMHRELFALLNTSDKDSPLLPTDFPINKQASQGYKSIKAKLGIKKPRRWLWTPFQNPARKDQMQLFHWRRVTDPNDPPTEYPFAKLNIKIDSHIPKYDEKDYTVYLMCDQWSKDETDHLMELCTRYDLRFNVIHDRWDKKRFPTERSVEDLKERYYFCFNQLAKARVSFEAPKLKVYDPEHERKRKRQLLNLYNRTPEQIEEEVNLIGELKKIEQRKRERERKTQDLQKIINAAEQSAEKQRQEANNTSVSSSGVGGGGSGGQGHPGRPIGSGTRGMPGRRPGRSSGRPPLRESTSSKAGNAGGKATQQGGPAASLLEATTLTIKYHDFKTSGATLRSHRMKLPASLGTKKMKALEQMIQELGLEQVPMPTEAICQSFNELRNDLLLLYELKVHLANIEFETQSLKSQIGAVRPELMPEPMQVDQSATSSEAESSSRDISDVIDVNLVNTPGRKRKAALEQNIALKKLKKTL